MDPVIIHEYGPTEVVAGNKFNVQRNGYSAMWFTLGSPCACELIVQFAGHTLKSVLSGLGLSALVPDQLLAEVGSVEIAIFPREFPDIRTTVNLDIVAGKVVGSRPDPTDGPVIPNFFVVGAPRSGTTSLYWHLSSHPEIFMAGTKEPYFFDQRAPGILPDAITSLESYLALFQYAPFAASIFGEASATYLSTADGLKKIKQFNGAAKILIILRNPMVATVSLYLRMLEGGRREDVADFNTAWSLSGNADRPFINNYKNMFMLGDQVETALSIFGDSRIKIILSDDLFADSVAAYAEVLEFLALAPDKSVPIPQGNNAVWKRDDTIVNRTTYAEMKDRFYPQIDKLSQLVGRDLAVWKTPYANM